MDLRAVAMGVVFAAMWASAFTSARIIVVAAPPIGVSAIRFLIAGLIAVSLARALGQPWRLTRAQWRATVVFGICQNALYLGLNFVAMQWIEASLAAIIASTMPLIVAFIGWAVLREKIAAQGLLGLLLGVTGVAVIMGARLTGGADALGIALCVIAVVSLAVATLSVRGASSGGNILMVVGLQMLVGGAVLAPISVAVETWEVAWSPAVIAAFLYTVFVPGLLATWLWFQLVERIGAVRAATFHFLTPPFGVAVAAVLLNEPVGAYDALGVAVVALGILLVQKARVAARG